MDASHLNRWLLLYYMLTSKNKCESIKKSTNRGHALMTLKRAKITMEIDLIYNSAISPEYGTPIQAVSNDLLTALCDSGYSVIVENSSLKNVKELDDPDLNIIEDYYRGEDKDDYLDDYL